MKLKYINIEILFTMYVVYFIDCKFHRLKSIRCSEHITVGTPLSDYGKAINVNFYPTLFRFLENVEINTYFDLNYLSGVLRVRKELDRENLCPKYCDCDTCILNLEIVVENEKEMHILAQNIEILDENDNLPTFETDLIHLDISESVTKNTVFTLPCAIDKDSLPYTVKSVKLYASDDTFELSPGETLNCPGLRVNKALDREKIANYAFEVCAYESVETRYGCCKVKISVLDENDNFPVFKKKEYIFHVSENTAEGSIIGKVDAIDIDSGNNGKIYYSLSGSIDNSSNEFIDVNPVDGTLKLRRKFDYENSTRHMFFVKATDQGLIPLSSIVNVLIYVKDENDNDPEIAISLSRYIHINHDCIIISEDMPPGTQIGIIRLRDADQGLNGNVYLVNLKAPFKTTRITDNIYSFFLSESIDRERKDRYEIEIIAKDHGEPARSSLYTASICVTDINDNPPRFSQDIYEFHVIENNEKDLIIGNVKVTDDDINQNSMISLSLLDHNDTFTIDNYGNIRVIEVLDRETISFYNITCLATDHGHPSLSSVCLILISVMDVNDNKPYLSQNMYYVAIEENVLYSEPLRVFSFNDADLDSKSSFSITTESDEIVHKYFKLTINGILFLKQPVDREKHEKFVFKIRVEDLENMHYFSEALVTINVLDANDNAPEIKYPSNHSILCVCKTNISTATAAKRILKIEASDKDKGVNSELSYSIEPQYGIVYLVNNNELRINESLKLGAHKFSIKVSDKGKVQLSSYVSVVLILHDSDNYNCSFFKEKYIENERKDQKWKRLKGIFVWSLFISFIFLCAIILIYSISSLKRRKFFFFKRKVEDHLHENGQNSATKFMVAAATATKSYNNYGTVNTCGFLLYPRAKTKSTNV